MTNLSPSQRFGQNLQLVRETRGLLIRELATRVPYSASYISDCERGQTKVTLEAAQSFADALSVSIDALIIGVWNHTTCIKPDAPADTLTNPNPREYTGIVQAEVDGLDTYPA